MASISGHCQVEVIFSAGISQHDQKKVHRCIKPVVSISGCSFPADRAYCIHVEGDSMPEAARPARLAFSTNSSLMGSHHASLVVSRPRAKFFWKVDVSSRFRRSLFDTIDDMTGRQPIFAGSSLFCGTWVQRDRSVLIILNAKCSKRGRLGIFKPLWICADRHQSRPM